MRQKPTVSWNRFIAASIPRTFKNNSLAQWTFNLIIIRGRTKTVFHVLLGDAHSKWDIPCVEAGFLPIGHTHSDIDQCFPRTADRLRHNNAITLTDLHLQLDTVYNAKTEVQHMRYLANWSQLCENTSSPVRVQNLWCRSVCIR